MLPAIEKRRSEGTDDPTILIYIMAMSELPCQNCGGGDRWCRYLSSLRGFSPSQFVLSPVWCSRPRPTAGVHLSPGHDEFRGPRSDYVRQVVLATTHVTKHSLIENTTKPENPDILVAEMGRGEKRSETRRNRRLNIKDGQMWALVAFTALSKLQWGWNVNNDINEKYAKGTAISFDQVCEYDRGRKVAYRDCGLSIREIGSRVGRNQTTVMRICDRWMQEGTTDRRGRSHPPRCTTSRESRQIVCMEVTDRSVTSRTVAQHIESVTHHSVSARTIRRRLQRSGLSARRPLLRLPLTQNHRRLRR
ncbi:transposable element Tcb1 transposase [Trichonephila clavipes]|nr:transposable element Tcb1 transposase [Trichonephila clavipes]